jgi:L-ascorbate metabolism protein UlaG (beta-lactamase superfamily)
LDITWLGHAAFRVKSGTSSVLMDPFSKSLGLQIPPQHALASVVTVSSDAPHQSAVDAVAEDALPVVFRGPGEYEAAGVRLKAIRTSRHSAEPDEEATNIVFLLDTEGILVCHLGDPNRLLTNKEIEDLGSPQVLLLPIGSKEGLSPGDAVEMVNSISPKIVVPMLFAHPGNKAELREASDFLKELGAKAPEVLPRLSVTRGTLPEETQLVMLQPAGKPL